jgi:hypothetical protein
LFAVVVVRLLLRVLAFVLANLFEGKNDVCGVGIIDNGELSPTFETFKRTSFYGIIMSVIDDSDRLGGEDGSRNWLSLCENRSCQKKTQRERSYPSMFHTPPRRFSMWA